MYLGQFLVLDSKISLKNSVEPCFFIKNEKNIFLKYFNLITLKTWHPAASQEIKSQLMANMRHNRLYLNLKNELFQ